MTTATLNRTDIGLILDSLGASDVVWALKRLTDRLATIVPQSETAFPKSVAPEDLQETTWTSLGLDKDTAKSCVRSMKDYQAGRYVSCRNQQELTNLFDSL